MGLKWHKGTRFLEDWLRFQEINNMLVTLLEKDKGPSRSDSDTEDSPYVRTLKDELEAL